MSLNLNKIFLAGRVVADPELKQTQSGVSVVSFRMAVNRYTKPGEQQKCDFFTVNAWRERADFVARYFRKGSAIFVSGQLQQRTWQDQYGNNRSVLEINADEVQFVESKATSEANTTPQAPAQNEYTAPAYSSPAAYAPQFEQISADDDLPF